MIRQLGEVEEGRQKGNGGLLQKRKGQKKRKVERNGEKRVKKKLEI